MRSIGHLEQPELAERFAAYLITQEIATTIDSEDGKWTIWVRDEDKLEPARDLFAEFLENPGDPKYNAALREAAQRLREEERRRKEMATRMVDVRSRWSRGGGVHGTRLTVAVIIVCIAVGVLTGFGENNRSPLMRSMLLVDTYQSTNWTGQTLSERLVDIRQGEVWRLLTPNFVHYGVMHLVMNMFAFYVLGGHVESRRGPLTLLGLIVFCGVVASLGELLPPPAWGASIGAAGLSGVVYGIAGFTWVSMRLDPRGDLFMPPSWWFLLIAWFLLGAAGILNSMGMNVANWAHGSGLLAGMIAGYFVSSWQAAKRS